MESSMKLSRLKAHMKAAYSYAELSKANRLKVGAVLVRDDRVISVGYNGTPTGFYTNVCENPEAPNGGGLGGLMTKPEVCHAEMNTIAFAAKNGIATRDATLVITDSPCFECCKLLVQAGITHVVYDRDYRLTDGLQFLAECGVNVTRIEGKDAEKSTE